jgi:hypothetical protein
MPQPRATHPTVKAALLMLAITVAVIALAALSTVGGG